MVISLICIRLLKVVYFLVLITDCIQNDLPKLCLVGPG